MQCHQVCTAHSPVRGWGHEAGMGAQKVGEPQIFKALLTVMWICGITGFRLSNNTPRGGENKITNIIPRQIRILFPRTIEKDRCYSKGYNRRCVIPKPKTCYSKALNHEGGLVGCGPAHCQRHDTKFRHAPALAPMCSQPHQLL